jgi:hypothetical protein
MALDPWYVACLSVCLSVAKISGNRAVRQQNVKVRLIETVRPAPSTTNLCVADRLSADNIVPMGYRVPVKSIMFYSPGCGPLTSYDESRR